MAIRRVGGGGQLLTTTEVAARLGVSRQWVNVLVRQGKVHPEAGPLYDQHRRSAYVFRPAEVDRYERQTLSIQVDWAGIRAALIAWQAAKARGDTAVAHRAHVEASAQMAKGNLIRLMTLEQQVHLSELLQADDPEGILSLIEQAAESAQTRPLIPNQYQGGILRRSWMAMLREMYLRFAENESPLSLSELESLATEGALASALAQLDQRGLVSLELAAGAPPHITQAGCERADHMRYHIIRRYESPGRTMEWYDEAETLTQAQDILNQNAARFPDAEHEIEVWEG